MNRGEKESLCLNKVREMLFNKNGEPICHPFDGNFCLDVDDATFKKEYLFYCNSDFN